MDLESAIPCVESRNPSGQREQTEYILLQL